MLQTMLYFLMTQIINWSVKWTGRVGYSSQLATQGQENTDVFQRPDLFDSGVCWLEVVNTF